MDVMVKNEDVGVLFIREVEKQKTFGAVRMKPLIAGDHMTLLEIQYPPEAGAPPHVHQHETLCYVVSGKVRVTVGEDEYVLEAGDTCIHPLGVPHGIRGIEHATVLEIKSPAQPLSQFLGTSSS